MVSLQLRAVVNPANRRVGLWAAWPFHRAAPVNARHGTATMDTLVSLGIIAACGWSVYAMFVLDRGRPAGGL